MQAIGYILRSFPRLSQTFILSEILALEERGVPLRLFASTDPREPVVQPRARAIRAPLHYLDAVARSELRAERAWFARHAPRRYAAALAYVRGRADLDTGYTAASRFACFEQALALTRLLRRDGEVGHLHAHFAHDPTLIALLVHKLTGISFSFTAHARDLFQIPRHVLVERVAAATALLTCCGANLAYLDATLPPHLRAKARLIHHGVDLDGFQPAAPPIAQGDAPPLILSVGRLVEKKGFPDLLRALARVKASGRPFRCAIFGAGPLRGELAALAETLGLAGDVTLPGERAQRALVPELQAAALFALTPFVTEDGDRDGVPNVLAEAMACGLPVVSTAVAGIPELLRHDENGLLCPARDLEAIAAAIARLLDDEQARRRLGAAARRTVVEQFDLRAAAGQLTELFAQATAHRLILSPALSEGAP